MSITLSTRDVPKNERFAYWNHLVSQALGRLDTVSQKASSFSGEIYHQPFGKLNVVKVTSNQLSVIRTEKLIAQETSEYIKVNFHLCGRGQLTQNGISKELRPGDWIAYDNTRPYTLTFDGNYEQLLVLVPKQQLSTRVSSLNRALVHTFSSQLGMGKIVVDFVKSTVPEIERIPPSAKPQLANTFIDLLALNLSQVGQTADTKGSAQAIPTQAVSVAMIKSHINDHLAQSDLSPETIANALHISKRYLHYLFQHEETPITRYIWNARLEQCRSELANPRNCHRSITDIAFTWGFKSSPHFSRLFKARYGLSPRGFRNNQNQSA
ncbi:MAG: helix-turn-helix domain-containing protein [Chloroflexota bacterium]